MLQVRQFVANRFYFFGILFRNHDHPAASVRQHMDMALARITWIERHSHQVGNGCAQKEIRRFERVVFEHADSVLRFETKGQQAIRHAHASVPGLSESEPPIARRNCLAGGIVARGASHLRAHIHEHPP